MCAEARGWLLDLYDDEEDGVRLWFILEDGSRVCLTQQFPVSFYVTGTKERLHQCCLTLRGKPGVVQLSRMYKKDVFKPDPVCVLQVDMDNPARQRTTFLQLKRNFPDLVYYNADLAICVHHAARYETFPMAYCDLVYDAESLKLSTLRVLNSRWDVTPIHPVLRILEVEPDCNPRKETPQYLRITDQRGHKTVVPLQDRQELVPRVNQLIERFDPDILQTRWGDEWLFPLLLQLEAETGVPLRVNRDTRRAVLWKKEITYFSYGQIIHREREAHLFGRCHIDTRTSGMWKDYALAGTLEMSRVTALPLEQAARVSPGSGISSMQMITALQQDILVPEQKQQVETRKTGLDLIHSDRGGLIYQPRVGLHRNVAQIDFISMYPAVIINGNISPEVPLPDGLRPASEILGVVPRTLKPLYEKRVEIKLKIMNSADKSSAITQNYIERASALKWLLVVCFGFLGYKNARFGKIEAHEAVTRGGREALLIAKEVCEDFGFEVLHLFVDALWIRKEGCTHKDDFQCVLNEIAVRTGMRIALDGIFRWIAFLPSRVNENQPVPNRYFGVFQDGSMKIRGIETRRRDMPTWVVKTQQDMLSRLVAAYTESQLQDALVDAFRIFKQALDQLNADQVPLEDLVLTHRISRELEEYTAPSAAVRAARQLLAHTGTRMTAGQKVSYVYTREDVYAWDQPGQLAIDQVDKDKYRELLARAAGSVLYPFGLNQRQLADYAHGWLQYVLICAWIRRTTNHDGRSVVTSASSRLPSFHPMDCSRMLMNSAYCPSCAIS